MKRLLLAVFVVLLSSAMACAGGFSVSGGAIFDEVKTEVGTNSSTVESTGYYIAGSGSVPGLPLALTGSYSSFSSDKVQSSDGSSDPVEEDDKSTISLLKAMVGYKLPVFPVAFGAGYVSQRMNLESSTAKAKASISGVAVGAFGTFAVSEQADIAAEFYYVPNAEFSQDTEFGSTTVTMEDEGSGWVFEVKGSYLITSQIGIEAGYRSASFETDDADPAERTSRLGGFFLGAKYSF